jgi:hypothetical protein
VLVDCRGLSPAVFDRKFAHSGALDCGWIFGIAISCWESSCLNVLLLHLPKLCHIATDYVQRQKLSDCL